MANKRIKDLATTATTTASDDFMAVDGVTNGTRKLSAATPAFLTSVTTPSLTAPAATNLTLAGGSSGASLVLGNTNTGASLGGGGLAVSNSASFVVGATAGVSTNTVGVPQISASSNTYSSIASIAHNTTDGNHGFIVVGKSRGTKASPTILADGDTFGEYDFVAYDGATYRTAASIKGKISGTPGASDLPTRLAFSVAADGAGSPTEWMNLMPSGNLLIGTTTDMSGSAGLKVASTSGSTGSTSGAIITPGGIYAGAASVFGSTLTATGLTSTGTTASTFGGNLTIGAGNGNGTFSVTNSSGLIAYVQAVGASTVYMGSVTSGASTILMSGAGSTALTLASTGAATFAGAVTIGNTVNSVSPTSPNRTVTMVVNGVTLYLAAKTTND